MYDAQKAPKFKNYIYEETIHKILKRTKKPRKNRN